MYDIFNENRISLIFINEILDLNTQKFHHNPMNSTSKICEDGTSGRNLAAWCLPSWVYRPPCLTWTGKEERGCSHGHPMLLFPITMEEVRVYGEIYGAAGEVVFRYLLLWDVRIWVTQLFLLHFHSSKSAATDVLGHLRATWTQKCLPTNIVITFTLIKIWKITHCVNILYEPTQIV